MASFHGQPPSATRLRLGGDPACGSGTAEIDDLAIRDGHVGGVVVHVAEGLGRRAFDVAPAPAPIVDQKGCQFVPRVVAVRAGEAVVFRNGDHTLHNVHLVSQRSSSTNFGLLQGAERTLRIADAEVPIEVRCDVHPWMRAFVAVVAHPYFAVTSDDGSFRLEHVPAGTYTVEGWQERLGRRRAKAVVAAGSTTTVDLEFGSPPSS